MSYIPRILIVDDEPQVCESLKRLLKRQGYDIFTAISGKEALEILAAGSFDLILLDLIIPDMDGFQIMDHISSQSYEIFTIVITGDASIESAVKALKKGAYDYLKKPFEYEELLKRVGNALNQKKLDYEKKVIDGKLERSEERYQYLVQNSPDIIYMLDNNGKFTFINITVQQLLGYPPEELIGKHFTSIVHEEHLEKAGRFLTEKNTNSRATSNIELKLKVYDNSIMFKLFEINCSNIEFKPVEEGKKVFGTYGVARDITYRKQLEDQLQHAKKMEAIGTLAGGIAHDFNNVLMGIMGYTSLLLSEIDPGVPYYTKLKSIEQHVSSGANLTKQLLGFARGGKYDIKPANINEIIEKTSSMFGQTNKEITINCKYQKNTWVVDVDEGQIEQVLLNLYVNASQAMPKGGYIYIETENTVIIDEQHSEQLNLTTGDYIRITIRDTGIGMDREIQQRVFEPFFTTQETAKGTGLGLASVYSIVKNHGGNVTVHSKKGVGTTFTIYIPASDKSIVKEEKPSEDIIKGSETVLLVDDEPTMIDVGVEILETIGYKALTARNGIEALKIYAQNRENIDIVIIDLIMPQMGGGELYDKIKAFDPEAKILLSSGYSIDGEASKIMQRGCNGFIQKPFGIKEISQKLREILDQ